MNILVYYHKYKIVPSAIEYTYSALVIKKIYILINNTNRKFVPKEITESISHPLTFLDITTKLRYLITNTLNFISYSERLGILSILLLFSTTSNKKN